MDGERERERDREKRARGERGKGEREREGRERGEREGERERGRESGRGNRLLRIGRFEGTYTSSIYANSMHTILHALPAFGLFSIVYAYLIKTFRSFAK